MVVAPYIQISYIKLRGKKGYSTGRNSGGRTLHTDQLHKTARKKGLSGRNRGGRTLHTDQLHKTARKKGLSGRNRGGRTLHTDQLHKTARKKGLPGRNMVVAPYIQINYIKLRGKKGYSTW